MTAELPDVKLRALVSFPTDVTGRTGVNVVKVNGRWYLDLDVSDLEQVANVSGDELDQSRLLVWNSTTDAYSTAPLALAATAGVAGIDGHTGLLDIGDGLKFTGDTLEFDLADQIASEAQARAGTNNATLMTPFRTAQAFAYSPEQFDPLAGTGDAEIDTAAWIALAAALPDGALVRARGEYLINGFLSGLSFTGRDLTFDLTGAVFRQKNRFSCTLLFSECTGWLHIYGGTFWGLGTTSLGGQPCELFRKPTYVDGVGYTTDAYGPIPTAEQLDGAGTREAGVYNGVAGLYLYRCEKTLVERCTLFHHAGGGIMHESTEFSIARNNYVQGCGGLAIPGVDSYAPIMVPGDNGSDFGIYFTGVVQIETGRAGHWIACNNRVLNHAQGLGANNSKTFISTENTIGPIHGQHGHYLADCAGVLVTNNNIFECGEIAVKHMLYRYYPVYVDIDAWVTATAYAKGTKVKYATIIWIANVDHTSGSDVADFGVNNYWTASPENDLNGTIISDNVITDCGQGVVLTIGDPAVSYSSLYDGALIKDNTITRTGDRAFLSWSPNRPAIGGYGIRTDRQAGMISGNTIKRTAAYAIYQVESGLTISDNRISHAGWSGIAGTVATDVNIVGNVLHDVCDNSVTTSSSDHYPIWILRADTTDFPVTTTNPRAKIHNNDIQFRSPNTDTPGDYLIYCGEHFFVDIADTTTNSLKPVRVDGVSGVGEGDLVRSVNNQFLGYYAAQHNVCADKTREVSGRVFRGSGPPVLGNWLYGDIIYSSSMAVGQTEGWVCIVAGGPGTWAKLPNLVAL